MKVSIITSCFNSASTIESTIQSVINQSYTNIEYIIIDGKSSDSTLDIVKKFEGKIAKVISEKDNGIYDALNKGISVSTGDIIGILHSDDFYVNNNVIEKIVKLFKTKNADAVYADLQYVDRINEKKITRLWKAGTYKEGIFLNGWMPPHPTFFVRTELYAQYGKFNDTFKSAADYELMLRMIHKHKIKLAYLPEVIVNMRTGGISNVSLANRLRANREDKLAWKLNNLKPSAFTFLFKPLRKINQFF